MPQTKPYVWYLLLVVIIVLALGAWFLFGRSDTGATTNTATTTDDVSQAIKDLIASGATSTTRNGYTVELVDTPAEGSVPNNPEIKRPIPATPDLDAAGRAVVVGRVEASVAALEKNPRSFVDWMDMGILRLIVKDYQGAKEAWEYAALLGPETVTPFANLGDLYANHLKDFAKAESNFKTAIANDAKNPTHYRGLIDLYMAYNKKAEAEAMLKVVTQKYPTLLDFHVLLARFYRDNGRAAEARAEYDVAISVATKAGNTSAASQLQAEKAAVK